MAEPVSISFPSGSVYYGGFVDKHREGLGEFRQGPPAGSSYRGLFVRGQRQGLGALVSSTGIKYFGEFAKDERHGLGVMVWPSGNFYIGHFAAGAKAGQGSMAWVDRGERYIGSWKDNAAHGEGVHVWYDMETSSAANRGASSKPGVATSLGLQVTIEGPDGQPIPAPGAAEQHTGLDESMDGQEDDEVLTNQRWPMLQNIDDGGAASGTPFVGKRVLSMYKGSWAAGKREGFGTFLYASGAMYMGFWQANLKHGPGIFIAADGQVFGGVFVNDRPVDPAGLAAAPPAPRRSQEASGEESGTDAESSSSSSVAPPNMAAEAAALAAAVAASQAYESGSAPAAAVGGEAGAAGPLISGSSPLYTLRIDDLVPRDDLLLQQHVSANGRVDGVAQTVLSRLRAAAVQNVDVVMLRWNSFLRGWYSTYATLGQGSGSGEGAGASSPAGPAPLRGVTLLARPVTEGAPRSPEEADAWTATGDAILSDEDVSTFGWAAAAVEMMLVEGMATYALRLDRDYRALAGCWEAGGDLCGAAPAGGGNASGSRLPPVMRLHQLWAFAQDTGMTLPPSLTLAAVDDLLLTVRIQQAKAGMDAVRRLTPFAAAVARLLPGTAASSLPPLLTIGQGLLRHLSHAVAHAHDPFRPVLFREFVEVLVRLAHTRFVTTGYLPAPYDAPEAVSATDYGNKASGGRPSSSASSSGASVAGSATHALTPRPVLGGGGGGRGLDAEGLPLADLLESDHESDGSGSSSSESDSEQPLLGAATTASIVALAAQRGVTSAGAGGGLGNAGGAEASQVLGGRRGGSLVSMGPGPSTNVGAAGTAPAPQPSLMGSRISINGVIVRKGDSRYFVPSTATGATSRLALARPTRRVPALGSLDELAYVCECMFWYHVAPHARGTADAAATLAKKGPRSARAGQRQRGGNEAVLSGASEAGGAGVSQTRDASAGLTVSAWRGTHSAASVASTAAYSAPSPRSAAESGRYAPGGSLASASAMTHTSRMGGRLPPFSAFGRSAAKRRAREGLPELTGGLDAGTHGSVMGGGMGGGGMGRARGDGGIRGPWMDPALDPLRPVVYLGGDLLRPVAGAAGGAPALDALAEATQARQSALRILGMLMQSLLPSTLARVCAGAASPGPAPTRGVGALSLRALLALCDRHILASAPAPSLYASARGGYVGAHADAGSSAVTASRSPTLSASVCALGGVDRSGVDTDTFLAFLGSDTGGAVDPLAPIKPVPAGVLLQILEQAGALEATGVAGAAPLTPRAAVIPAPEPPAPAEAPKPPSAGAAKLSKQQLAEAAEAAARAEAAAAAKAEAAAALHRDTVAFAADCPAVGAFVAELERLLSECPGFTLRTAAEAVAKTLCPYPLQHDADSALPVGLAGAADALVVGGRVVPLGDLLQTRLVASEVAEALLRLTVARADCRARRAAWLRTAAARLNEAAAQGSRELAAAVEGWVATRRAGLEATAAAAAAAAAGSRPQTAASGKSAPAAKPATAGKGAKGEAAEAGPTEEEVAARKAAAAAEDAALTSTLCGALGAVLEDLAAQAREALAVAAAGYKLPPPFSAPRAAHPHTDSMPGSPGGSSIDGPAAAYTFVPPSPGGMSADFPDMYGGGGEEAGSPRSHAELLVANPDDVLLGLVEPAVPFLPLSGLQQQDVLAKIRSGMTSLLEAVDARLVDGSGGGKEGEGEALEATSPALLLLASPKRGASPPPSRSSHRGGAGASPLRSPLKSPSGAQGGGGRVIDGDAPMLSPPRAGEGGGLVLSPGAASVASTVEESNAYGDDFDE